MRNPEALPSRRLTVMPIPTVGERLVGVLTKPQRPLDIAIPEVQSVKPSDILQKDLVIPSADLPYTRVVTNAVAELPEGIRQKIGTTILETAFAAAVQPIEIVRETAKALDKKAPDQKGLVAKERLIKSITTNSKFLEGPNSAEPNLRENVATAVVQQELGEYFESFTKDTAPTSEVQTQILQTATELTSLIVGEFNEHRLIGSMGKHQRVSRDNLIFARPIE